MTDTPSLPDSRHPLSWDEVHAFLLVVQAGSIAGASRLLGVNHSTVLRRLGSLEDTVSTRLFDRLPGGYALTASGHEFAERLAGVAEQIASARDHIASRDVQVRGTIRVTAPESLMRTVLMPLIARFSLRYPAVQLQLALGASLANLTKREADVAVRASNHPPENLVARRVGRVATALYASRAYLASLPPGASQADYRWVAFDESMAQLEQSRWMERHVAPERIAIRVDNVDGMVEAVACGAGAGLLVCPVADRREELVQLAPADPSLGWDIWILTHPELRQVARIRAFTDFLFEALQQEGTLQ